MSPSVLRKIQDCNVKEEKSPAIKRKLEKSESSKHNLPTRRTVVEKPVEKPVENESMLNDLHNDLKVYYYYNNKKKSLDIPMVIEKTHQWRRKRILNNQKLFLELFNEYNYFADIKNVSRFKKQRSILFSYLFIMHL